MSSLIGGYITTKIDLGEFQEANELIRLVLTRRKSIEENYFTVDTLIYTEKMLGHIDLAKELALAVLESDPEHVMPRNELIRFAIMEGDKRLARRLIQIQKSFYEKVKKDKSEKHRTYEKCEAETAELEGLLEGKSERNE